MADHDHQPLHTPPRAIARGSAGLLLLVLWLAWSLTALWLLQRPAQTSHSPDQILAALAGSLRHADHSARMILPSMDSCPCLPRAHALEASLRLQHLDVGHSAAALPYPLVVVQGGRLIYAGPADPGIGCGPGTADIVPLIRRLLATPQSPMVVPVHCPCSTELFT